MFWKVLIVTVLVTLSYLYIDAQEITPTTEPFPTASSIRSPWSAFPSDMYCEDLNVSEGSTWGTIEIGYSTVEELKDYIHSIGEYESVEQSAGIISFIRSGGLSRESELPFGIVACLDGNTVVALTISAINQNLSIQDIVAEFGIPDAVTWGSNNISRTVFWFDEGIAASVYILEESDILDYGKIGLIVYFPYQSTQDFEERWPYNRTNSENPTGGDRVYEPPPSEAQNPFNFADIVATITAEPSRTPTPTFAPPSATPTITATATP